jgi:3-oxoacyl-[acyl-carrier protein] reductase
MPRNPPPVEGLLDLTGKVALVTGANAGIGRGIAERLAAAGAKVAIQYRGGEAHARALAAEIGKAGGRAYALYMELTDAASVEAGFRMATEALGPVDILVNNAARQTHALFTEMTLAEWQGMMAANLDGVFLITKAATDQMAARKSGGAVVNIASISGLHPSIDHGHYAASKAALIMYTKAAAAEFGPLDIRVNAVSPGVIYREGIEEAWPSGVKRWMDKVPLGDMGTVEDIGDAVLFLASPASRFITGVNLIVDGGMTATSIY